ncbi:Hypothetical predicted protein, partial [Podarcis lilfordi]
MAPKRKCSSESTRNRNAIPRSAASTSRGNPGKNNNQKPIAHFLKAFRSFIDDYEQSFPEQPSSPPSSPDAIPDTQVVPESPRSSHYDELPSTSAALFSDAQLSRAGSYSRSEPVRTRSQSKSSSASRARGKVTAKSTRVNNPVAPSSSNRSQEKRPRAQLPESASSSAAEDEQQEQGEALSTPSEDKPSGKRREKKKHICRKSKSRRDDTDEETGSSSSEYDSDASLGSYWGKGEEVSGLPDWALSRRANSHRKKFGGTQEWKDGALVKASTISTYSTSDVIPGDHLSPKLRAKILNGEFVDMFKLVPPTEELGRGEKRPSHGKRKSRYPSVPRTFENWLDGFQAFMGTIVAAYPKRAVHLVAYLSHIRTACALSGEAAAINYDKKFRRKASRIPLARWDQIENGI